MDFNMNRTWSQATTLLSGNFQLLAVIAGVFLLLPSIVLYIAMPDLFTMAAMPQDPDRMSEAMMNMMGPLLSFGLIALLFQIVGYGAMIDLMGGQRPTVGEAIARGIKCLLPVIGAIVLFGLVYLLLAFLISLVSALLVGLVTAVGGEGAGVLISFLVAVVLLLTMLYIATRFSLTLPVIVLERQFNPAKALLRSWRLTSGHSRAIFGFYVLLLVAYVVIAVVVMGLVSVVGAALGGGTATALFMGIFNGLIGALVAMLLSGILVSMHQQLGGSSSAEVSETFE